MSGDYGLTSFVMESGERFCHVIDRKTGVPKYYPCLFLTTQVRNRSHAFSTVEAAATHLLVLLRFLDTKEIDLNARWENKHFFKPHELDQLRDFAQTKRPRARQKNQVVSFLSPVDELEELVTNQTLSSRLTTIAYYLQWLAWQLISDLGSHDSEKLSAMVSQIGNRRPFGKERNQKLRKKYLDDKQIDALFEVIRINSNFNPFMPYVQRRNRLMILVLYHLGVRSGELLSLRIRDIYFDSQRIQIVRRPDEKDDPRGREQNAKTEERNLPISDALAKEIHGYIQNDRRHVARARKNDFLFVTYKSGPTVGQPISYPSYHRLLSVVGKVAPDLYKLTGHKLRHTWNERFSEKMDRMDVPLSAERQEQIRSYLMGWKQGSGTAATYNKRFTEKKGHEAALAMQETSNTKMPGDSNNG